MRLSIICKLRKTWRTLTAERSLEARVNIRPLAGARLGRRRGALAAELAVVAPIVFFITLGIIDVGRCLMVIHLLNNAAQLGCRAGIIEGQTTANIKKVVVDALTSTGVSGETATVQINDGGADASTALTGDEITVIVKVPVSSICWVPVTRFPGVSLQGQYTMRRE